MCAKERREFIKKRETRYREQELQHRIRDRNVQVEVGQTRVTCAQVQQAISSRRDASDAPEHLERLRKLAEFRVN